MTDQTRRLRKAVLPVAGLGTRVLPGTKTTPKEPRIFRDPSCSPYNVQAESKGARPDEWLVRRDALHADSKTYFAAVSS